MYLDLKEIDKLIDKVFGIDLHDRVIPKSLPMALHCKSLLVQIPDAHLPLSKFALTAVDCFLTAGHFPLFQGHRRNQLTATF